MDLGDLVKDRITGFTGILVARAVYAYSSDRLGIKSRKLESGKPIDVQWFDACHCDVIETGLIEAVAPNPMPFKFLDRVRDTLTGYEGIITGHNLWITGCRRVSLQGQKFTRDGAPVEEQWPAPEQLVLLEKTPEKREAARTGGPMPAPKTQRDPKF